MNSKLALLFCVISLALSQTTSPTTPPNRYKQTDKGLKLNSASLSRHSSPHLSQAIKLPEWATVLRNINDVVQGLLVAITSDMREPDIAVCINNVDKIFTIAEEIQNMVEHSRERTGKNVFILIKDILVFLAQEYESCQKMSDFYHDMKDKVERVIRNPGGYLIRIQEKIIEEVFNIVGDIKTIASFVGKGEWFKFGEEIGNFIYEFLIARIE